MIHLPEYVPAVHVPIRSSEHRASSVAGLAALIGGAR
jgi:hypothetical protein